MNRFESRLRNTSIVFRNLTPNTFKMAFVYEVRNTRKHVRFTLDRHELNRLT